MSGSSATSVIYVRPARLWRTRSAHTHENDPPLDICLMRPRHPHLSRRPQRTLDLLYLRRRTRRNLASHSPTHRQINRQTLRRPLTRHTLRLHLTQPPNRRLPRRMARWDCNYIYRKLFMDVVSRCSLSACCGVGEFAD